jgi:DNA-binding CsgD family transcriptional regulator
MTPRRPKRFRADDSDYGVDQLDNTREEVHPYFHRDATPDDRWLSPFNSEAVQALLVTIGAAQAHSLEPERPPDELDIRALAEDAGCTEKQIEVFMFTCAGQRQREIAVALGISQAAVWRLLDIARRKLVRVVPPLEVLREVARALPEQPAPESGPPQDAANGDVLCSTSNALGIAAGDR